MVHYYVNSDTGNDANDGSDGNPVATVTQAFTLIDAIEVSDAGPHEVIITNNGVYNEGNLGFAPLLSQNTIVYIMAQTGSNGLPLYTPTLQGSGSDGTTQFCCMYVGRDWIIRGIKFEDWIPTVSNAVLNQKSYGDAVAPATTVELCEFTKITGSCFTADLGGTDNGHYIIQNNTFHDIMVPSSSNTNILEFTNPKKCYVYSNVFYDIQYGNVSSKIANCAGTRNPENIFSHNTFGTSSVQEGTTYNPTYTIDSLNSRFEYNIIYEQTANTGLSTSTFARIDNGEAYYNIYYNVNGQSSNAPFGGNAAPTASVGNQELDPLFKGPLVGNSADYRLAGTNSPAFDAAIGSSNVTTDRTGRNRFVLDSTAFGTGIFDIGAYEITEIWSQEVSSSLPVVGADFTINRFEKANSEFKRGTAEGNASFFGKDVDQVPFTTALNGAVPAFIRKKPSQGGAYKVNEG